MDGYWPAHHPSKGGLQVSPSTIPHPPFPLHYSPSAFSITFPIPSRKKSPAHRFRARCSPMSHAFVPSPSPGWYDVSRRCTWFTGRNVACGIKYSCITISIRPHRSLASHRPRCVHTARFRNQPWEEPLPGTVPYRTYIHTWSNVVLCSSLGLFSSSSNSSTNFVFNFIFNFIFNFPRVRVHPVPRALFSVIVCSFKQRSCPLAAVAFVTQTTLDPQPLPSRKVIHYSSTGPRECLAH